MAIDLAAEQQKQQDLFDEIVLKFSAAKDAFTNTETDPGSGFDLDAYLNLIPTPSLRAAEIETIIPPATYDANDGDPSITPPTLITPSVMVALASAGYDSAYLEEIEQEIRAITADVITHVLPASLYDEYFLQGRLWRARETRDNIDKVKTAQGRRGFPGMPMAGAKQIGQTVSAWQRESYEHQEKTAEGRLQVINKIFFSSINHGIDLEEIRAQVIMKYARMYAGHNKTLSGYYDLLVDEKIAEAQLALTNAQTALKQDVSNVETVKLDNEEEVALPTNMLSKAMKRLENEFQVDQELILRREKGMQYVANTYGAWMAAATGSMQATTTGKHTTAP